MEQGKRISLFFYRAHAANVIWLVIGATFGVGCLAAAYDRWRDVFGPEAVVADHSYQDGRFVAGFATVGVLSLLFVAIRAALDLGLFPRLVLRRTRDSLRVGTSFSALTGNRLLIRGARPLRIRLESATEMAEGSGARGRRIFFVATPYDFTIRHFEVDPTRLVAAIEKWLTANGVAVEVGDEGG